VSFCGNYKLIGQKALPTMRFLTLTHTIGLAAALFASATLQAQTNRRGEAFPQQNLSRNGRAQEIPALLGAKLTQVAACEALRPGKNAAL
jgi:hypothetical protein